MKPENAIEVKDVTKKFKVYLDKGTQIKERLLFLKRNRYESRQLLKGISFEVKKVEAIGVVGHYGCGKSSTLKLLTRILYPDSGSIEMRGRISSLIELGAGFHPDMSGRENIYTNASIFGLTKKEIDERLDDIIAFSELEEFLDNPVRTYSSGMYMRLAFSVAINVDADVLLIDEILAVGDANFQTKCFNKLREIKKKGTTIVIVSHSLSQIEQICDRSIWIHQGEIRAEGPPRDVHPQYLNFMDEQRELQVKKGKRDREKQEGSKRWGNGDVSITKVKVLNNRGEEKEVFHTGDPLTVEVSYEVHCPVKDAIFGIAIYRQDGTHCYGTNTRLDGHPNFSLNESGTYRLCMEKMNLLPGEYLIDSTIECGEWIPVDYFREVAKVEFRSNIGDVGVARLDHHWNIEAK